MGEEQSAKLGGLASPGATAELTWTSCFCDAALELRYRHHCAAAGRGGSCALALATLALLSCELALIGEASNARGVAWTRTIGLATIVALHVFERAAARGWRLDAHSHLQAALLACVASSRVPALAEARLAAWAAGEHGACVVEGAGGSFVADGTLSLRAGVLVALALVLDLDVVPYAGIIGLGACAQHLLRSDARPGLRALSVSPLNVALGQAHILALAILADAHMNRVSRESFFYRISALEQSRVRADEVLKASTAEAAQLARSRLIRVVMHDLRSPLLAVSNVASMLAALPADAPVGDATVQEAVDALGHCSALAQNIVSDMLDFERIDSGRMVLAPSDFRVRELLRGAEATFSAAARERGVRLSVEMPTSEADALLLNADMRRLQQVLNNGVSNALKFTDAGGHVAVRARVRPHEQDGWVHVHLTVTDTGIGLGADELQLLCQGDAFAQVGRGQLQGNGGTGLGLCICRHLLELHNGSTLALASDGPGKGTTFEMIVACPVRHDAGADALAAPVVRGLPSDTSARLFPPGFRVLYAEDDRVLSFTMRLRVFQKLGVPTDYVENGQEAVAMAAGREYSVIVLDNQMPVMCGADAARALRAGGFAGTIIGVTGDPSGCVERGHFEASGLTMCVDKDSAGLAKLVEAISAFGLASDCAAPFEGIPCTPSGQLSDLSMSTTSLSSAATTMAGTGVLR